MSRVQVSFNLGQVDKGIWKRFDDDDSTYYSRAAQDLTNLFITSEGNITRRVGSLQFSDVTEMIAGRSDVKFFILNAYVKDQFIQKFICVRVSTDLYISLLQFPLSFSLIELDEFTTDQIKEAFFGVLRSDIVVCHPRVNPVRIQYNGSVFTKSDFQYSTQATFDDNSIDYSNVSVVITPSSTAGDPTIITLTPDVFGLSAPLYKGGYIVGPGSDPYSPFGTGTISDISVSGGVTTLTVSDDIPFSAKTVSSDCKGSKLSIQRTIFNNTDGFPSFATSFQNRAWWGGHPLTPQTIFGTVLGTENNLDLGTGDPTDAIVYTIAVENVGRILYFNVGHQFEVYCEKGFLTLYQNLQGGITPTTFTLKNQSQNKPVSLTCRPISFDSFSFYSGLKSATIYKIDQNQNGDENTYSAKLASIFAKSLVPSPVKLVGFLGADGSSIMMATLNVNGTIAIYMINEDQDISGWTPFKFTPDFTILDIDSDGNDLYLLVRYNLTSKVMIEVVDFSNTFFVDHAIPVSILESSSPQIISGLDNLNNCNVYLAGFAESIGPFKVVGGEVTIPAQTEAKTLYAGIDSGVKFRTMYLYDSQETAYNYKSLERFYLDYEDSLAITVNGYTVPFDQVGPIEPQTDTYEFNNGTGYGRFETIEVSQYAPVCLTITSLSYFLSVSNR